MKNVFDIESVRPHINLKTIDGNIHIFPTALVFNWINGTTKITDVDDWELLIRSILKDWIENL